MLAQNDELLEAYFRLGGTPESLELGIKRINAEILEFILEWEYWREGDNIMKGASRQKEIKIRIPENFSIISNFGGKNVET